MGGRIDTPPLAEDTSPRSRPSWPAHRVPFAPHATVWAEEPGTFSGLWKQRLRWARGNVQVTRGSAACGSPGPHGTGSAG